MKTLFKSVALFVMLASLSYTASAADVTHAEKKGFETGIFCDKSGKLNVNVDKYNRASTVIRIVNDKGTEVYREAYGKNQMKLRSTIDLNEYPNGNYTLEISSDGQNQENKFEINHLQPKRTVSFG
ncbi:hypothetical protein DYBT9275_01040 [Dyadobacter sp. CECT 9275]|uniref:Secretion system C-terminal sorting domain-containing protein n=1 Tax=Dyadobacter helix TaxID=2822344 RepID=A0A916JCU7_9BACT|nr:T9SS type A sorting domain-containing protein [Dyadobacter sp. CECT 9275]CAG4992798.1 hypothetical protein DYBT9275_01040 [Dyadobacter sp. CECT 9275]